MSVGEIVAVVVAVFAASAIQTISGFGFALFCVSVMSLAVDTKLAVVTSTLVGCVVVTVQAVRQRQAVVRERARRLTTWSYAGMPVGYVLFRRADENTLRMILGISVLVAVGWLIKGVSAERSGGAIEAVSGVLSGALTTSLSTSGPPLVFSLQASQLPPDAFRATITMVFALQNVGALSLFISGGDITREGIVGAIIALPAMVAGQYAGMPFRSRLQGESFRRLVLVLLTFAAISTLSAALTS